MTRTSREILSEMETLLTPSSSWTKHAMAKDVEGDECSPFEPHAQCFCLLGAKNHVVGPGMDSLNREVRLKLSAAAAERFPTRALGANPGQRVATFNDHEATTHTDVLDVIRLAQRI